MRKEGRGRLGPVSGQAATALSGNSTSSRSTPGRSHTRRFLHIRALDGRQDQAGNASIIRLKQNCLLLSFGPTLATPHPFVQPPGPGQ